MTKTNLRSGYTTGACAAAGVKATLLFLCNNRRIEAVNLTALDGTVLEIPIESVERIDDKTARAAVIKDSGDDPDITNGATVLTTVKLIDGVGITFIAGEGVGHVTKAGLTVPIGEPAINSGPRQLIRNVVDEFDGVEGVEVTISIPNGVELAKRTLNPTLGIEGGLSIIGTTGVLRPMSEDAFKRSLVPQIDVALAAGFRSIVFVPGKIGETIALERGIPRGAIVQTSNFIGYMLEAAAERGVERVILFGHIGKLAKVAAGVFHTHNRVGDGRLEVLAAYSAAAGLDRSAVERILSSNTTEEAISIIVANGFESVFDVIAARASARAERYIFDRLTVGIVLVSMDGTILGADHSARLIGKELNCNISSRQSIPSTNTQHKIIVAGIGPGSDEYVSPAAINAINHAKVLVGGKRALKQFAVDDQITFPITGDVGAAVNFIRDALNQNDVTVIVSGDPGYYSMLDTLLREFDQNIIEVIPSISAVQIAFARCKMPWHNATLLSFHGRRPSNDQLFYNKNRTLGLLTDGNFNSQSIAQILIENDWPPATRMIICARLSYPDETITETTLEIAANDAPIKHCILIVGGDNND